MLTYKELRRLQKETPSGLPCKRIALLGDTATQMLTIALRGTGVSLGIHFDIWEAEYDSIDRLISDAQSEFLTQHFECVILFQSTHRLLQNHARMDNEGDRAALADNRLAFIKHVCTLPQLCSTPILVFNYPEIDDSVFGSFACGIPSSFLTQTRILNAGMCKLAAQQKNMYVVDIASLQNKYGRDAMFSPSVYASTEMVLSLEALPHVAARCADIITALSGRIRKCLITDLDNTLWGGVIGDDGLENIQIGHFGIGRVFTELQLWMKKLRERGIILCVVSKNDEQTAREPFIKHPDMELRLDDFAVFIANWENKAENIRQIQSILNIGYDQMVFLDDNPFERGMVREHLPDIVVPELPDDAALYLEYLYSLNLFETTSVSAADSLRTRQYQEESARRATASSFVNEDDYLKSLCMQGKTEGFTTFNIPRAAQLTQRSNQFNLRTQRYTESEVETMAHSDMVIPLCVELSDRFGQYGLISVVILKKSEPETLFIDTWLMSCRVLKRGVEAFVMNSIIKKARTAGIKRITGAYIPTPKNNMVSGLLPQMGFALTKTDADGTQHYALNVADYKEQKCFIEEV